MAILGRLVSFNHLPVFGLRSLVKDIALGRPFLAAYDGAVNVILGTFHPNGDYFNRLRSVGSVISHLKSGINHEVFMGVDNRYLSDTLKETYGREGMLDALEGSLRHLNASEEYISAAIKKIIKTREFQSPITGLFKREGRSRQELLLGEIEQELSATQITR